MRNIRTLALGLVLTVAFGAAPALAYENDCWGQATAAFAQMGKMGQHASQQEEPRFGLPNLARQLYDDGVIEAPDLQALGAFLVSIDPDLTVEACME
jgi:hypothetical protein